MIDDVVVITSNGKFFTDYLLSRFIERRKKMLSLADQLKNKFNEHIKQTYSK